jgi:hypothetical protein
LCPQVYVTVLSFDCRITEVSRKPSRETFPIFLGPILRGAFGFALKELCCDHPDPLWRRERKSCPENCRCAYKTIFLSPSPPDLRPPFKGRTYKPHPFTLRAPWLAAVDRDNRFSFEVTVIGEGVEAIAGFLQGFSLVGKKGLREDGWAWTFDVGSVSQILPDRSEVVWLADRGFMDAKGEATCIDAFVPEEMVRPFLSGIRILFSSPLSLVYQRRELPHLGALTESILAVRAVHAIEEMGYFWCGVPPMSAKPIFDDDAGEGRIDVRGNSLYCRPKSSVQEGNVRNLGGLLGEVVLLHPRKETIRALAALLHIGIGQNRVYGFGRYELAPL